MVDTADPAKSSTGQNVTPSRIPEDQRRRSIQRRLSRMETTPSQAALSTGFPSLDSAMGSGLPRGRIVEWFGDSSSGKTTLALQVVAHLQRNDLTAAWVDAEHTFDPAYAASLGVAVERLPVLQPDSAEHALEIARQLAQSGAVDLLVFDSAAALVPSLELETEVGLSSSGLHSRVLASGLRGLAPILRRTGATALFLNQTRRRLDPSGGETETTAGGASLKLYAAVRMVLAPSRGRRLRCRVLKNKTVPRFGEAEFEWREGSGFMETP